MDEFENDPVIHEKPSEDPVAPPVAVMDTSAFPEPAPAPIEPVPEPTAPVAPIPEPPAPVEAEPEPPVPAPVPHPAPVVAAPPREATAAPAPSPAAAEEEEEAPSSGRSKRARKSVQQLVPEDFSEKTNRATIVDGRGTKLEKIPSCKQSIHDTSKNSEEMKKAHSLLFGGHMARKYYKDDLLAFNGFLPKKDSSVSKEEQEAIEEDLEAKMSEKAFKMTIPELKTMCDFFTVDRSAHEGENMTKEVLVDRLLDFLGEPSTKLTKKGATSTKKGSAKKRKKQSDTADEEKKMSAKKKKKATKKVAAKKESDDEIEENDEEADDDDDKALAGGMPTEKALRKWVRAYVACFNMQSSTIKHALETASDKFGVDLSDKKALLKQLITDEM